MTLQEILDSPLARHHDRKAFLAWHRDWGAHMKRVNPATGEVEQGGSDDAPETAPEGVEEGDEDPTRE